MDIPQIVVTGASRGIGRAVAKELVLQHGHGVLAVARDAEALASLKDECAGAPGRLSTLPLDLMATDAPEQVARAVGERRVLALVNDAGLFLKRPFGQWTAEDAGRLFHLNAAVPMLLAQALAARLEGNPPGHVVNIGSMGGFQGSVKFPGLLAYSASKAAVANVTECLAEEFRDRGIRCNCLCIGAVDTAMLREAFPEYKASVTADAMGAHIARFALEGHNLFNGKLLPVSISTP
jgi:3-oxoacyl-[acyl-carrier protein] reductase